MSKLPIIIGTTLVALISAGFFWAQTWAEKHTTAMMGGVPGSSTNCISCHGYMNRSGILKTLTERDYVDPGEMVFAPDGNTLYALAEKAEDLLVIDVPSLKVVRRLSLGDHPTHIALCPSGKTAYVSNSWTDDVSVIDLARLAIVDTLQTGGGGPAGLAVSTDGKLLFVANSLRDEVVAIEVTTGALRSALPVGNHPYAVDLSPDGKTLLVTSRMSQTGFRDVPRSEITVIDAENLVVRERKYLTGAHLVESVSYSPAGDLALVTLVRPKNLVPSTQINKGWMLTYGIGVVLPGRSEPIQLLLDEPSAYYADPFDVVVSPDGSSAFVSHAAADLVTAIDMKALRGVVANATPDSAAIFANHLGLSRRFVRGRIETGSNPRHLVLSPDGKRLFISERLSDRIAVVDAVQLQTVGYIDLGGPETITNLREGERLFYASRAFQGQFSCRSCHPDGDQDALAWDFSGDGLGMNIVNSMTLRDIGQTAPYKWAGLNVSLYMQDGIRFAKHLTRVDPWPHDQLRNVVAYIYSIPQPGNRFRQDQIALSDAEMRGKKLFERTTDFKGKPIPEVQRCITCHPPPYFTNRTKFDVGTHRATDKQGMLFDTPQLINIFETDPYLHDGSASSLEEIWTINSLNDEHGLVSDFAKTDLNDLVSYLKTLGPPKTGRGTDRE